MITSSFYVNIRCSLTLQAEGPQEFHYHEQAREQHSSPQLNRPTDQSSSFLSLYHWQTCLRMNKQTNLDAIKSLLLF